MNLEEIYAAALGHAQGTDGRNARFGLPARVDQPHMTLLGRVAQVQRLLANVEAHVLSERTLLDEEVYDVMHALAALVMQLDQAEVVQPASGEEPSIEGQLAITVDQGAVAEVVRHALDA